MGTTPALTRQASRWQKTAQLSINHCKSAWVDCGRAVLNAVQVTAPELAVYSQVENGKVARLFRYL